jgi:GR25 family glycosyltransferase involved in LPS biosynthesis
MDAEAKGCRTALVFEDDVLFVRPLSARKLQRIAALLQGLPEDWHILHLGHWPLRAWFVKRDLLRTISACAHAYVISPRTMTWLREHPYGAPGIVMTPRVGRALDSAYSRLPGVYALFPMLATQSISRSDNFNAKRKPKTKLKHWVTRSRYREFLLSNLMRPFELLVVLLSPYFWLRYRLTGEAGGRTRVTGGAVSGS